MTEYNGYVYNKHSETRKPFIDILNDEELKATFVTGYLPEIIQRLNYLYISSYNSQLFIDTNQSRKVVYLVISNGKILNNPDIQLMQLPDIGQYGNSINTNKVFLARLSIPNMNYNYNHMTCDYIIDMADVALWTTADLQLNDGSVIESRAMIFQNVSPVDYGKDPINLPMELLQFDLYRENIFRKYF